jgi:hypothetical protein
VTALRCSKSWRVISISQTKFAQKVDRRKSVVADREAGLTKSEILRGFGVTPTSGEDNLGEPRSPLTNTNLRAVHQTPKTAIFYLASRVRWTHTAFHLTACRGMTAPESLLKSADAPSFFKSAIAVCCAACAVYGECNSNPQ